MVPVEQLGLDPEYKPSSQPVTKTGPNRGRRRREVGGTWHGVAGYTEYSRSELQSGNWSWARALTALGIVRVGYLMSDGCTSFYVFVPTLQERVKTV